MRTTRVSNEARCPACKRLLTAATDFKGSAAPKPDDLTVCAYCTLISVFNTDLTLRALRLDEFDALPQENKDELRKFQLAAASFARERNKDPR